MCLNKAVYKSTMPNTFWTYLYPIKQKSCEMWSSAVNDIGQAICSNESRTMISQAVTCGVLDSHTLSDRTRRHRRRRVRARPLNRGLKLPIFGYRHPFDYLHNDLAPLFINIDQKICNQKNEQCC